MNLKPVILALFSILLFSSGKPVNNENRYYSLDDIVIEEGSIYVSYNINIAFGGYLEMNDSLNQKEVNKIIVFLKDHSEIEQIEIGAHLGRAQNPTSSRKSTQVNSEKIKEYMVRASIDRVRLIAKGYEFNAPLIDTGEEYSTKTNFEAYTKNSRFEFKILKLKP